MIIIQTFAMARWQIDIKTSEAKRKEKRKKRKKKKRSFKTRDFKRDHKLYFPILKASGQSIGSAPVIPILSFEL